MEAFMLLLAMAMPACESKSPSMTIFNRVRLSIARMAAGSMFKTLAASGTLLMMESRLLAMPRRRALRSGVSVLVVDCVRVSAGSSNMLRILTST